MRLTVGVVLGLVLVASGCGGPRVVDVDVSAGSARLGAGETLRVDIGDVNPSIGDSWHLVTPPDSAVLAEKEQDYDPECEETGCGSRLRWIFTAVKPGETTMVFRYCYRSRPDNCQAEPSRGIQDPVSLNVTVS